MPRSRPDVAGVPGRAHFEIHTPEALRSLRRSAESVHLVLELIVDLLGRCAPAHPVSAGAVLALLDPVAGDVDTLRADLDTLSAAHGSCPRAPSPLRGASSSRAAGA